VHRWQALGVERAEYRRLLTEAYDLDKPTAPPAELAFYRECVALYGEPVLELMCGSGRFLVPLRAAGVDVDGCDASADMLAGAERRLATVGGTAALYAQAVEDLDLPRRYAFVFCGGGSFGLLRDDADVARALARIREHLLAGGGFLLEVETPSAGPPQVQPWTGRWWRRPDGATIVLRGIGRYDSATRLEEGVGIYELFVDGTLVETELNGWVRRFWEPSEIVAALTAAEFVDVRVTRAFTAERAADGEPELSVLARG
jgi:methyltransferase family protein